MKKVRQTLNVWLACVASLFAALTAHADVAIEQLAFTEVDGGYAVAAKEGEELSGALVIPQEYNGKPVVSIADWGFYNCKYLTSVEIPNSVTSIGGDAFFWCENITSANIPDKVKEVSDLMFAYCRSLTSITIPNSVESIGMGAFYGCENLVSVVMGSSVAQIDAQVFDNCPSLTDIVVYNVNPPKFLSTNPFKDNTYASVALHVYTQALEAYKSNSVWGKFYNITDKFSLMCNQLHFVESADGWSVCAGYREPFALETLVIPSVYKGKPVTAVLNEGFSNKQMLKNVSFPESVTSIGESAFAKTGLVEVVLPNSIVSIGDKSFNGCSSMTSLKIGDSVTSISSMAFGDCYKLESVEFGKSVSEIGESSFEWCMALKSLNLPASVTSIGDMAFYGCRNIADVTSLNLTPPAMGGADVFSSSVYQSAVLHVLDAAHQAYADHEVWGKFTDIRGDGHGSLSGVSYEGAAGIIEVYDVNGVKVGNSTEGLQPGIYVVRCGNEVKKCYVK